MSGGADLKDPFGGGAASDLAKAEQFVALNFTDSERQQMVAELEGQLELIKAARGFRPANDYPPAHVFDPRLPGVASPSVAHFEPARDEAGLAKSPGDEASVAFASLTQLSHWLRTRQISSLELTDLYLRRLERLGPELECTVTLLPERARAQARAADAELAAGRWRGPLHGVPWGAKDLLDVDATRTTWGAMPYRDRVATRTATVVRRLDAAGAVLIAKLSLGALAYGDRWFGGLTRNPWNIDEGSSGSSAGSAAATVAGLVGFSLGTETLGSIVSPSTRCGATGLRPTFGRVSRAGAMVVAWSLDKIGPICRRVEDTALVLSAIDGADPADPATRGVPLNYRARPATGMCVAVDEAWFAEANVAQKQGLATLKKLGVDVVRRRLPERPHSALLLNLYAEAAAAFEALTFDDLDDQLVWQDDIAWPNTLRMSRLIPAADCVQADRLRRRAMEDMRSFMSGVDAAVSPSFGNPLLTVTNFTGHPSLTLPVGFETRRARDVFGREAEGGVARKVPTALTLWGPLYDEGALFNLGRALEREMGVAGERPPV